MHLFLQKCWEAMFGREDADFVPQIEHPSQGKIQEITAATSGVEDADSG